jgi:NAD(P)-dependent dehydrogenase (short-subunit alcohol dehydrogenase family)
MGRLNSLIGGYAGYRLSKAALNAQTILWANENPWATFVAVCPGWVKTDMGGRGAPGTVGDGARQILWAIEQNNLESGKMYTDQQMVTW